MENKAEFGYTAETQSEQKSKTGLYNKKIQNSREREITKRALESIKLPRDAWNSLIQDIQDGAGKKTICARYGIKSGYFKYIKQIVGIK